MRKLGIGRALVVALGVGLVYAASSTGCGGEQDDAEADKANASGVAPGTNAAICIGGPTFDPAGAKNVGNGVGTQFIGGQCLGAKDCASGCCAKPCGICSGPGAQFQAGKQGCGFEAARPPAPPSPAPPPPATRDAGQCVGGPAFDPAGAKNVGNGMGQQFIGGQCLNAKDCASGCCALPCGICSGPGAQFQAGKQGCGFGG